VIRCDDCGAENSPGATFCISCGRYLGWQEDSPPLPPEPLKPAEPPDPSEEQTQPRRRRHVAATSPRRAPDERPSDASPQALGIREVVGAIDASRQIASTRGRNDLDQHLASIRGGC
jgi:hypothetical protein